MDTLQCSHASPAPLIQGVVAACLLGTTALLLGQVPADPYALWDDRLTPVATAPFSRMEPFEATYRLGWEGVAAGGVELKVSEGRTPERLAIMASGGPNEWVYKLWNYHADYYGEAGSRGEVPSWFHMDESVARGSIYSDALFSTNAVYFCHRLISEEKPWWYTPLPGVRDLFASMLFIRSQPLRDRDHLMLTIFPDQNPYLVDLTVEGRETLMIQGRKTPAIRFSIRIRTIQTMGEHRGKLEPHKKFHSGRVWMSDDSRRLPLKAEVDVFIGSVFAELEKINPAL